LLAALAVTPAVALGLAREPEEVLVAVPAQALALAAVPGLAPVLALDQAMAAREHREGRAARAAFPDCAILAMKKL
jgi:hypothetical protein